MNITQQDSTALILVVEDDHLIREALGEMFRLSDFHVVSAQDGVDGLSVLRNMPFLPDVIVCDMHMDRMNGKQFFKAVQTKYKFSRIPFIFLSALPIEANGWDGGAHQFVEKPFTMAELNTAVSKALGYASVG